MAKYNAIDPSRYISSGRDILFNRAWETVLVRDIEWDVTHRAIRLQLVEYDRPSGSCGRRGRRHVKP